MSSGSASSGHVWKALQLFFPSEVDFAIFCETCLRWRPGQSMYLAGGALNLNFNPPHFYALLALAIVRMALRTIVREWTTHDRWLLAACHVERSRGAGFIAAWTGLWPEQNLVLLS